MGYVSHRIRRTFQNQMLVADYVRPYPLSLTAAPRGSLKRSSRIGAFQNQRVLAPDHDQRVRLADRSRNALKASPRKAPVPERLLSGTADSPGAH